MSCDSLCGPPALPGAGPLGACPRGRGGKGGSRDAARAALAALRNMVLGRVPALEQLRGYSLHTLHADVGAGLAVATLAVPQAMAYASSADLPPQYGLYTAIILTASAALFTSSRQLISGPTNAIAVALLSALAPIAAGERVRTAVVLALLVGLLQTGGALLRLGRLVQRVPPALLAGFTTGAGLLLGCDQIKYLLGLPGQGPPGTPLLWPFWRTLAGGQGPHAWTAAVGLGTLGLLAGLGRLNRGSRVRVPESLVAVLLMTLLSWACALPTRGVQVVGAVPARLPSFAVPALDGVPLRELAGSALAIALLGLLEGLAISEALADRTGQVLDVNQQCLSEGLANLAGSFFQCFPGSGSLTRSALNHQAGAMTPWSGVFAAAAVAASVVLFAPLAEFIPRATLAAILLVSAWYLVDARQVLRRLRGRRGEACIILGTALSAVAVSIEFSVLAGLVLSLLLAAADRVRAVPPTVFLAGLVRRRDDPRAESGCRPSAERS